MTEMTFELEFGRGQQRSYVLDQELFESYLEERQVETTDHGGLTLSVEKNLLLTSLAQGRPQYAGYDSEKKEINLGIGILTGPRSLNKNLAHEAQHFIDDVTDHDRFARGQKRLLVPHAMTQLGCLGIVSSTGLFVAEAVALNSETIEKTAYANMIVTGLIAFTGTVLTRFSRLERRARRAEKDAPDFFKLIIEYRSKESATSEVQ